MAWWSHRIRFWEVILGLCMGEATVGPPGEPWAGQGPCRQVLRETNTQRDWICLKVKWGQVFLFSGKSRIITGWGGNSKKKKTTTTTTNNNKRLLQKGKRCKYADRWKYDTQRLVPTDHCCTAQIPQGPQNIHILDRITGLFHEWRRKIKRLTGMLFLYYIIFL